MTGSTIIVRNLSRYAVSQLFAGCILLDGTKALLINCVESYGRKKDNDPHAEQYSVTDRETSIPAIMIDMTVCVFD